MHTLRLLILFFLGSSTTSSKKDAKPKALSTREDGMPAGHPHQKLARRRGTKSPMMPFGTS